MNIVASYHAVQRWRERAARYGDENVTDIRTVLAKAITLQGQPPKGKSFYQYEKITFVLDTTDKTTTVITVVAEDEQEKEYKLEVKRKQGRSKEPEPKPKHPETLPKGKPTLPEVTIDVPEFSSIVELRDWLKKEVEACCTSYRLSGGEEKLFYRAKREALEKILSSIKGKYQIYLMTGKELKELDNSEEWRIWWEKENRKTSA